MSSRDKLLYIVLLGFTIGVFLRAKTPDVYVPAALVSLSTGSLFLYLKEKKRRVIFLTSIFAVALSLGVIRFVVSVPPPSLLLGGVGETISLTGVISSDPDIREFTTKLSIETDEGTVLVTAPIGAYAYGDEIMATGTLTQPENFETTTGRTFNYEAYLGKDGIYFEIKKAKVVVLSHNHGNSILSLLFTLKHAILNVFSKTIPDPERTLLGGILLGIKQSLGTDVRDALVATGTIHIVALSGYNVSVVAGSIMRALSLITSRTVATMAGGIGIVLFVLMTGASSTAIRAGLMALLALIAKIWGRPYDALRILFIAGVAMLIYNPHYLTDDISFQLSFLATLGIIVIEPILRSKLSFLQSRFIIELFSVTLAAQIAVLPFLVWAMGTLSLVSLPINIFVGILIPYSMFGGALVAFLGLLSMPCATPVAYLEYWLLHILLWLITKGASVPYASIIIPPFSGLFILLIYGLILWWVYTESRIRVIKKI